MKRFVSTGTALAGVLVMSGSAGAGLIGYWPFEGNANDLSGNGNNAAAGGSITYQGDTPPGLGSQSARSYSGGGGGSNPYPFGYSYFQPYLFPAISPFSFPFSMNIFPTPVINMGFTWPFNMGGFFGGFQSPIFNYGFGNFGNYGIPGFNYNINYKWGIPNFNYGFSNFGNYGVPNFNFSNFGYNYWP